jgi:hypothetical protein
MRGCWLVCGVLALVACKGNERPVASSSGSSSAPAAPTVADAHVPAAPALAISCGPAMLAPRIPASKAKPKQADMLDALGGTGYGLDLEGKPGIVNGTGDLAVGIGNIGQGQGASARQTYSGPPSIKFVTFVTQGPLDKPIIERWFKRARPRFQSCYERELGIDPDLSGKAMVQIMIDAKGQVKTMNASGVLSQCVSGVVKSMPDFPHSSDEAMTFAKVELKFEPGSSISSRWDRHNPRGAIAPMPKPKPKPAPPPPISDARSWTPYAASVGLASNDVAQAAGDELVKIMPLAKLEACFAGKDASERTMVQVAFDGNVIAARSGGSGDAQVDACISTSIIGLKVTAPPTVTELACDIVRGKPQPWRVATESYSVLEVSDKEIKEAGAALTKKTLVPAKTDGTRAFLIVADPAAPPALVAAAFERTQWSAATLVALKTDPGAPIFIAMGRDGRTREKDYAPLFAIERDKDNVKSCADDAERGTAPKAEIETLLQTLAKSCDPKPCPATLSITLGGTMQDLATAADAARRAGLPRIGLSTTGCP